MTKTNERLIRMAASLIKAKKTKNGLFGDVASVLVANNNSSTSQIVRRTQF